MLNAKMLLKEYFLKIKDKLPIILIMIASVFVYIWKLWDEGLSNLYYSAGVYSMGQNLHAFFYNSIDSVGFISIDKPPLGLWIQVLFTKIFGFNGVAILLPEALAGIFSVYILYEIIDKRFSRMAAITSAFVLAFTPILAAVCRNNTIDGVLIFMLVLASWQAIVAAEKSSVKNLIWASVFIALGFNVKSLQAYMIVPAVYLTYLVFSNEKILKRIVSCFISIVVLIVISFSWVILVDFTPAQNRPYVGSSGTNSELNLTLGNNGMGRLIGGDYKKSNNNTNQNNPPDNQQSTTDGKNKPRPSDKNSGKQQPNADNSQNNNPSGQNGNQNQQQNSSNTRPSGGESGPTSAFRLYILNNAGQISWFLLPAFLFSLIFILLVIKKRLKQEPKHISLFYFSMCFLPMLIYFSFSNGVVHRYYLAMLAFPIAALIGIGFSYIEEYKKYSKLVLPILFLLTASVQIYIQSLYQGWLDWLLPFSAVLFVIVLIILIINITVDIKKIFIPILMSVLLIMPCIWSLTPIIYGNNAQLPIAGPELVKQGDAFDRHPDLTKLIAYLKENKGDATYIAAVPSAMSMGAELILQSKEPVMVLGGFNGGDNPLSVDEFQKMVADGKVKYAILSNDQAGNDFKQTPILNWIAQNGMKVTEDLNGVNLYQFKQE